METDLHRHLGIYLNDHLAGSAAGVGRARSARDANQGTEFHEPLARVADEIAEDRATLEAVMDDLGIGRSKMKTTLAGLGERAGRLKPNGSLRGYSPLGRVIDLEVLVLGITGKLRLWVLLGDLVDGETAHDFIALARRAEEQRELVAGLQERAARLL
jgi:hypothetical protein